MFTGAVTDFLDLHWRGLHWPAFNLADVFIVLAAIGWGLDVIAASASQDQERTMKKDWSLLLLAWLIATTATLGALSSVKSCR